MLLGEKKIILLLDSDVEHMKQLAEYFESEGFEVHWTQSGEDAIDLANRHKISLFIADILLPKRHGIAIAWEMRTLGHEFPIIIASEYLDRWDKEVFRDCRINKWIPKPIKTQKLMRMVEALL